MINKPKSEIWFNVKNERTNKQVCLNTTSGNATIAKCFLK